MKSSPVEWLRNSQNFACDEDIGGINISLRRTQATWTQILLTVFLYGFIGFQVYMYSMMILSAFDVINLFTILSATFGACVLFVFLRIGISCLDFIFPVWGTRFFGYTLRLTDASLILPGGFSVPSRTIPLDAIKDVREGNIPLSIQSTLRIQPTGRCIEIVTADEVIRFKFPMKWEVQREFVPLLQERVEKRRAHLLEEGLDLSEEVKPPEALARLLQERS